MARKIARSGKFEKSVLAWFALAIVIVWLVANLPGADPQVTETSSTDSQEATETTTEPAGAPARQGEVTADILNFRSAPVSEDRNIIKSLTRGTVMTVKKKENGWLFVELETGQSGYVVDKPGYVKIIE